MLCKGKLTCSTILADANCYMADIHDCVVYFINGS
jgi:hypothetical protein